MRDAGDVAAVDRYLAALPDVPRAALERLRRLIRAAVPDAEECISYRLPTFRRGRMVVSYGATGSHCALYPLSPTVVRQFARELAAFDVTPGTIRFQPGAPIPAALVRRIVKARVAEIAAAATRGKGR